MVEVEFYSEIGLRVVLNVDGFAGKVKTDHKKFTDVIFLKSVGDNVWSGILVPIKGQALKGTIYRF